MPDLWVLAGQSNMEGCGRLVDVEAPSPHVRCFTMGDVWKQAEEPLHWLPEAVDLIHHRGLEGAELDAFRQQYRMERTVGTGLGLTFAKVVSERTGIEIDLVPTAHGGTSMTQWDPSLKHKGGESLYGAMYRQVSEALASSSQSRLRGVLWYQGESDTNLDDVDLYLQRTQNFIHQLRADFNSPHLPFYLVQLGCWNAESTPGDDLAVGWQKVREAQRILPTLTDHTAVVSAVDLELDDGIHIGTAGLKRLGKRFANIALNQTYGRQAATGPKLRSVVNEGTRLRVSFDDVSRMLITPDPTGRATGFSLDSGDGKTTPNRFYRTFVDPLSPTDVLLLFEGELSPKSSLFYGAGVFPFCQLIDAEDMSVPAFGPAPIF